MWRKAFQQITRVFSPSILRQAKEYVQSGHVLNLRLSEGLLKARIKGNINQIFTVNLDLKNWPKQGTYCTCNESNCLHVATCFFALENQDSSDLSSHTLATFKTSLDAEEIVLADNVAWYSNLAQEGHDFFAYQLGILIDDQQVSVVPLVASLIGRWNEESLSSMSDDVQLKLPIQQGKVLVIRFGRIKPLLRLLLQYNASSVDASVKLRPSELMLAIEAEQTLSASRTQWQGTHLLREQLRQLSTPYSLPVISPPQGLQTTLRDYQQQGLSWLQCLRQNSLGGILADDMGLGKTVQTLAHLLYEKEQGRMHRSSLIIAPKSLVTNWFEEAKRFTPQLRVLVFHGWERHQDNFADYDVVVTTYGLISRDEELFLNYSFYYLILDEAHLIKNSRTKTAQLVKNLEGKHRLCLTGTPLENHLGELWSLFHFLMPGFLGTTKSFRQLFKIPIEKHADSEVQALLAKRVQPFMLRRRKQEVAKELPEKIEMTRFIDLSGPQRDVYEAIRMSMEKKVRDAIAQYGLNRSHITVLDALLKLRQICCDPRLLSLPSAAQAHGVSAKLEALMDLIDNLMEEERHVLVFSQFTSMLKLIEEALSARKYPYLLLTGKTENRQSLVHRFQAGEVPIFLISLKAGGMGLNLTKADTVIHYDPWWNPAVEDQATDRSHRIGQGSSVFVYKLIAKGTVEEVILQMQTKKRQLIEGVLSTDISHRNLSMTQEDVDQFFTKF